MMFCPQCGASIEEASSFCTNCGAKLDEAATQEEGADVTRLVEDDLDFGDMKDPSATGPTTVEPFQVNSIPFQAGLHTDTMHVNGQQTPPATPQQVVQTIPSLVVAVPQTGTVAAPAEQKGLSTGGKAAIISSVCVLGAAIGIALAVLHPWAPSEADSSSAAASSSAQTSSSDAEKATTEAPAATAQPSATATPATPQVDTVTITLTGINGDTRTDTIRRQGTSQRVIPDSNSRAVTVDEIMALNDAERNIAYNEIIAAWSGYSFKNSGLASYFTNNCSSWYTPSGGSGGLPPGVAGENVELIKSYTDSWYKNLAKY